MTRKTTRSARRPNIVLTIADDQRFDTIGAHGNWHIHTPALDRLALSGTSYHRAYIPGSTHGAVCAPSRAQLHTGRLLFQTSDDLFATVTPPTLDREASPSHPLPTLGQSLRAAGYDTYIVGKWHNGASPINRSFGGGSRLFLGGMSSHFCVVTQEYDPRGEYKGGHKLHPGHSTDVFAGAAIDFIRRRAAANDRPFFLYVAFTAPHDPRETFYKWHRKYDWRKLPVPPNFLPRHPFDFGHLDQRDEMIGGFPRTPEETQFHLANYYAMVSHMDDGIGSIHGALEEAGLTDSTIRAHTADHALGLGQHGLFGKQNLYEHSIHVPLIVAGPGVARDKDDERLCYMQDLFPTLLDAAGAEAPKHDFVSLTSPTRRKNLVHAFAEAQRCVRDKQWKLIRSRTKDGGAVTQLFDVLNDPWEMNNRASDRACARPLKKLEGNLAMTLDEWADPLRGEFGGT